MTRETKSIRAVLILEVIGKPREYLTETIEKIIEQMGKEKGVEVKEKKIKEPVLMKDKIRILKESKGGKKPEAEKNDFYITFAEVEVEVGDILHLAILMFKYMPSHIEVISPELITLSNNGWSDILSELTRRLHGYDEVARVMQIEKKILETKLRNALENREKKESKKN